MLRDTSFSRSLLSMVLLSKRYSSNWIADSSITDLTPHSHACVYVCVCLYAWTCVIRVLKTAESRATRAPECEIVRAIDWYGCAVVICTAASLRADHLARENSLASGPANEQRRLVRTEMMTERLTTEEEDGRRRRESKHDLRPTRANSGPTRYATRLTRRQRTHNRCI